MAKSRRNNSLFKKSLIIYTLIAAVLVVVFLIYIFLTLKSYEKGQTTNVIKDTILSLDDSTLKEYLKDNKQSEDLLNEYKKLDIIGIICYNTASVIRIFIDRRSLLWHLNHLIK